MKNAFESRIFWTIFTLASLAFFALGVNQGKTWRAEIDLLIVSKNEIAAGQLDDILADSVEIPRSLSFYERILLDNQSLSDEFKNLSSAKKQDAWRKKISLSRVGGSGIVKISVLDEKQKNAEEISWQSGLTLASYLSRSYNIKTDLEAKIINGPISKRTVSYGFLPLLLVSAALSLAVSFVLFAIFSKAGGVKIAKPQVSLPVSLKEILGKKEKIIFWEGEPFEIGKKETKKEEVVEDAKKAGDTSFETEKEEIKKEEVFEKQETAVKNLGKKASAPANLPVSDEEAEFLAKTSFEPLEAGEKIEKTEKSAVEKTPAPKIAENQDGLIQKDLSREPTEEEVRERMLKLEEINVGNSAAKEAKEKLNRLLRGEF